MLPPAVPRHHTAWISCSACRPHPVRYAVDGDQLVCFRDQLRDGATDGRPVFVTVHEIAGGQAVARMNGPLRAVAADDVDPGVVIDLLEHVSLGRTADEVAASLAQHRRRPLAAFSAAT
jgi:hypothetical protein